jgi:hypothetical protein
MKVTILSLAQEMQSFIQVGKSTLDKAGESKITNKNNNDFKKLVRDWQNGVYDEDPAYVISEIEWILSR